MAGGAGTRFWPLSRMEKPKQFIDVLGLGKTFLQMTAERFLQFIPEDNIYVVTNQMYATLVKEQLPFLSDEQILLEPVGRNTAPCIAYASYKIYNKDKDANIVVAPSDHLILENDKFQHSLETGLAFTAASDNMLTLGVVPTRPETGYGYIQCKLNADTIEAIVPVKTFTEKPHKELAEEFLESGDFLWNSGIFVWRAQTIITAFEEFLPELAFAFSSVGSAYNTAQEQDLINDVFVASRSVSIDYGILEKAGNVHTLRTSFSWTDLGTWGGLHDIREKDEQNNSVNNAEMVTMYESINNTIHIEGDIHAVLQGLDGYVVVASKDILLVCQRQEEQRIKQFVADLKMKGKEKLL